MKAECDFNNNQLKLTDREKYAETSICFLPHFYRKSHKQGG